MARVECVATVAMEAMTRNIEILPAGRSYITQTETAPSQREMSNECHTHPPPLPYSPHTRGLKQRIHAIPYSGWSKTNDLSLCTNCLQHFVSVKENWLGCEWIGTGNDGFISFFLKMSVDKEMVLTEPNALSLRAITENVLQPWIVITFRK